MEISVDAAQQVDGSQVLVHARYERVAILLTKTADDLYPHHPWLSERGWRATDDEVSRAGFMPPTAA